ncbi:MAG TPA: AraC family transcriptional regulator [Pyrinomonadaceae bacterium]|jgi:AraC family transcriptional regulator
MPPCASFSDALKAKGKPQSAKYQDLEFKIPKLNSSSVLPFALGVLPFRRLLFPLTCIKYYFVQINWRTNPNQSPYLFRQMTEWSGVKVHRARVLPGRMIEQKAPWHELHITLGGQLITEKISASGKLVTTKAAIGNLCLTPAGQTVGAHWEKPLDNMGILLAPDFVVQTAVENRFASNFEFTEIYKNQDPLIQHIGLTLLVESGSETPSGRLYADSLIQTLILHLLKNYSTANSIPENLSGGLSGYRLRRVTDFINANLEKDLSLAEIAAVADLSQYHFARAFRKTTGLTPQHYVMQQRIERAKELLLAKDDLPLVEISLRSGFKNQSHFTALFRKFTKLTPKTWRELKLA